MVHDSKLCSSCRNVNVRYSGAMCRDCTHAKPTRHGGYGWRQKAACWNTRVEEIWPQSSKRGVHVTAVREQFAVEYCRGCPVARECREEATILAEEYGPMIAGVWDGQDWNQSGSESVSEWSARLGVETWVKSHPGGGGHGLR